MWKMADRKYLFRLQILIIDGGLLVLRNVLEQKLSDQGITLGVCLNNEKPAITRLKSRGMITQVQYDTLFPPGGRIPTSSDLDITLTICLLRGLRCFGLNRTFNWYRAPRSTDVSFEADIWRLKYYRNVISHIQSTTEIDQTKFQNYWEDIEQVLIRLNPPLAVNIRQKISDFESCPLDEEQEYRTVKEIENWEQYENKVDRLQEDILGMKSDISVSGVKIEVSGIKTEISGEHTKISGVKQELDYVERRQDEADKMKENASNLSTDEVIYQRPKKYKMEENASNLSTNEEIYKKRKKDDCVYDGRLIELSRYEVARLCKENTVHIGQGSFGNVYKSNTVSERFGIHIVVKKIALTDHNESSIKREMITSRLLHPFLLPLLAVVKKPEGMQQIWFVTPLCTNGDLNYVIKSGITINARIRVKILLQIALAIEYIHTPVKDIREVILHKDISSKNVLLDVNFNARLADFGSARENDDLTATEGGNQCYAHPDIGEGTHANESWDYYSFGIIIREMVTSLGPMGRGKWLKKMSTNEVKTNYDVKIWNIGEMKDQAEMLNEIASNLLHQKDWKVANFIENVTEKLKQVYRHFGRRCILDPPENKTCHSCMINKKVKKSSLNQAHNENCGQKIELCIACEKNCFLNPIKCYCGVQLTPDIGSKWGALLVGGKDTKNPEMSFAIAKDVKELEKLLSSQAPRVFGISKENIQTVVTDDPSYLHYNEQLWNKVEKSLKIFSKKKDIDTLLIYISCHGDKKSNTFDLGDEDQGSTEEFQTLIEALDNIKTLIIILDRCYPPMVQFQDKKRIYLQINCCKENEQACMSAEGSIFTKYLIRGLKAKSEGMKCPKGCQPCLDYWESNSEYIEFQNLVDFIKDHIKDKQMVTCSHTLYDRHSNIAFYTSEKVSLPFSSEKDGKVVRKEVELDYMKSLEELKAKLKELFGQEKKSVNIYTHKVGRKDKPYEYCDNIQRVMLAWVQRLELEVIFD